MTQLKNLVANTEFRLKPELGSMGTDQGIYVTIPEMSLDVGNGSFLINVIKYIESDDEYICPTKEAMYIHPDTKVIVVSR